MTDHPEDTMPDWPPAVSASSRAEGERAHGSTGQLFIVQNRQWVRVREPRLDDRQRSKLTPPCDLTRSDDPERDLFRKYSIAHRPEDVVEEVQHGGDLD